MRQNKIEQAIGRLSLKVADNRSIIIDILFDLVRIYRSLRDLTDEPDKQRDITERIDEILRVVDELKKYL